MLPPFPERLIFRFLDTADDDLADDSTEDVIIQGIGRCGTSEYRYNVTYAPSVTSGQEVSGVIHSYEGPETMASENCNQNDDRGQYFVPTLPAGTLGWSITHVEVYLMQHGAQNGSIDIALYYADGSGNPDTLIEKVTYTETQLPSGSFDWHSVPYGAATGFSPGVGLCLTLEPFGSGNAITLPFTTGLSLTDSHFLAGTTGTWSSQDSSKSILFRIHGSYTTPSGTGDFTISPGTWQRTVVP